MTPDHATDLLLRRAAEPQTARLDLRRGVLRRRDAGRRRRRRARRPARLADGEDRSRVEPDEERLERGRVRGVRGDDARAHAGVDRCSRSAGIESRRAWGCAVGERGACAGPRPRPRRTPCTRGRDRCRARPRPRSGYGRDVRTADRRPAPRWYHRTPMAELRARVVAFVERHPRYFPDAIAAVGELIRVLGDVDPFLIVGRDGHWLEACADDRRQLPPHPLDRAPHPAGRRVAHRPGRGHARRAADPARGRTPALCCVATDECPTGENEDEPGGESFGYTTLIGRTAGLRRIGVNLDVVAPGRALGAASTGTARRRRASSCSAARAGSTSATSATASARATSSPRPRDRAAPTSSSTTARCDLRILSIGERRPDDVVEYAEAPWEPERPDDTR